MRCCSRARVGPLHQEVLAGRTRCLRRRSDRTVPPSRTDPRGMSRARRAGLGQGRRRAGLVGRSRVPREDRQDEARIGLAGWLRTNCAPVLLACTSPVGSHRLHQRRTVARCSQPQVCTNPVGNRRRRSVCRNPDGSHPDPDGKSLVDMRRSAAVCRNLVGIPPALARGTSLVCTDRV